MLNGFLNLYKPRGMTSNSAVYQIKRTLKTIYGKQLKVGHLGTLDPMAEGVLPVVFGEATKSIRYLPPHTKTYVFTLKFGASTSTYDADGEITETSNIIPTQEEIAAILPQFIGEIMQAPPKFSAIKIKGVPAYKLARRGQDFKIKARPQRVDSLEILSYEGDSVTLRVVSDQGFYVRTLAVDIAEKLGAKGHITYLKREASDFFTSDDAIPLDKILNLLQNNTVDDALKSKILSVNQALDGISVLAIDETQNTLLRQGKKIITKAMDGLYRLTLNNDLSAMGRADFGLLKACRVFNL